MTKKNDQATNTGTPARNMDALRDHLFAQLERRRRIRAILHLSGLEISD